MHQQSKSIWQGASGIGHHALSLVGHDDQLTVVKLSVACIVPCCCVVAVRLVNVRWEEKGLHQTQFFQQQSSVTRNFTHVTRA